MEKLFFRAVLLLMIWASSAIAAPKIYVSCTEGGGCNSYRVGGGGGGGSVNIGGGGGRLNDSGGGGGSTPERVQKAKCLAEKNRIEKEKTDCAYNVANDGARETARCNSYTNKEVSGGVGLQHHVVFFNADYTVQNPTYDKCVNQVNAAVKQADAYCGVVDTRNRNAARVADDGACSSLY